jgi:hypothetical protein
MPDITVRSIRLGFKPSQRRFNTFNSARARFSSTQLYISQGLPSAVRGSRKPVG